MMIDYQELGSRELLRLLTGYQVSALLYVAAELDIAGALGDDAKTVQDIARLTDSHGPSLRRLLRALAAVGVVQERDGDRFGLTSLGMSLRTDLPGDGRALALWMAGSNMWQTWGDLLHCVRTGESAFGHLFGTDNVFDYYESHPTLEAVTSAGFAAITSYFAAAILKALDFSRFQVMVDVGGGRGALLAAILRANQGLRGILFDLPHVVRNSTVTLRRAAVDDRCRIDGGDMFLSIPSGADAYILSRIIHDWPDVQASVILANCRTAMRPDSTLFVVERVLPERAAVSTEDQGRFLGDINMLVRTGGRERSLAEYRTLLDAAGLKVERLVETTTEVSVIEIKPVG